MQEACSISIYDSVFLVLRTGHSLWKYVQLQYMYIYMEVTCITKAMCFIIWRAKIFVIIFYSSFH